MKIARACLYLLLLIVALIFGAYFAALATSALTVASLSPGQTVLSPLPPDIRRALGTREERLDNHGRKGAYTPAQARTPQIRSTFSSSARIGAPVQAVPGSGKVIEAATPAPISPGTPLSRVLHTSQLSLVSAAGSDEGLVDSNSDLMSDQRTTFDNAGGSFDIAVGQSGARYEVYSATLQNANLGVLVVALDSNSDYSQDSSSTYNLKTDFSLPSAAAVVTGTSKSGREFVIISSSGFTTRPTPTIRITSRHPCDPAGTQRQRGWV